MSNSRPSTSGDYPFAQLLADRHYALGALTTRELEPLLATGNAVVLLPVGSVEPHGPHLPLATDTLIGKHTATLAAGLLSAQGFPSLVAPAIPYGVTQFAAGFAGAVSCSADALTGFLVSLCSGFLAERFCHVCLISHHLEPAHDQAVRAVVSQFESHQVSVASPLSKVWGKQLSGEFKSGACHAGQYETSLILASNPAEVRTDLSEALPALPLSLSKGIRDGVDSFKGLGMTDAYTGAPAQASLAEGQTLAALLADLTAGEVMGHLPPSR